MKSWLLSFSLIVVIIATGCKNSSENGLPSIIASYDDYRNMRSDNNTGWADLSDSTIHKKISVLQEIQSSIQKVERATLSENELINYDMLTLIVEDDLFNLEYGSHLMPLNAEGGFLTGMIYGTQNLNLDTDKKFNNYRKKLSYLPAYLKGQTARLNQGIKEGKVLPTLVVNNCISLMNDQFKGGVKGHFLNTPLDKVDPQDTSGLRKKLELETMPAILEFRDYLVNEYLPKARPEVGVRGITDGKVYYEQRVKYFTTLDMTPEEVFQTGEAEVARIRAEMEAIIEELGFEGSFADFFHFLRTDPQFYAKTPQELLSHAAWLSKKAEEILPKYFGKLPRNPFTVNPVPAAIAPTYTGGRYSPGSYTDHRAGEYWVNTYKLESRPLYVLPSLTLHEAVPGHHLQGSLAQEIEDVPNFRRRTYLSAFGEGWGLYSEFLGKEAGIYTTPYEDFGRLTYEMWRACRLVVDPGMHYMGWTREQAVEFMASNTALSFHEVNTEIDRYIGWPAQAVSYKIGEIKIRELRKKAERELGENFDIRKFHDKVLENGSVPLRTLEYIIERFIEEEKDKDNEGSKVPG